MPRKLTQSEAEEKSREMGFELISQYINASTIATFRCFCGKEFECKPISLWDKKRKSCGCSRGECRKLTIEEVKKRLENTQLELIGDYNGVESKTEFRCRCGNIFLTTPKDVFSGNTTSCRCENKRIIIEKKRKNLAGKRFGRLKVIEYSHTKKHGKKGRCVIWKCLCDCGNTTLVSSSSLLSGDVVSCNCYRKEQLAKVCRAKLEGKRFGKLTVLKFSHTHKQHCVWKCKCDCGNTKYLTTNNLSGGVSSCGKCVLYKGEFRIKNILQSHKIPFEQQQTFKKCRNPNTNKLLRFDFYLPTHKICIEYNGSQHYAINKSYNWCKTRKDAEKQLKELQYRDQLKRDFCLQSGIKLLEIPYWEFNKIEEILVEKLNLVKIEEIK